MWKVTAEKNKQQTPTLHKDGYFRLHRANTVSNFAPIYTTIGKPRARKNQLSSFWNESLGQQTVDAGPLYFWLLGSIRDAF